MSGIVKLQSKATKESHNFVIRVKQSCIEYICFVSSLISAILKFYF